MNEQIDDKTFEEYLKRGSPVSRQYQALESDEVPADIDREVLARAEQAVRSPAVHKRRAWQRWSIPVGLAVSAVLALSIVMESGQHEQTLVRRPSYAEPAQDASSASPEAPKQAAESSVEPQPVELHAAPMPAREEPDSSTAAREQETNVLRERMQRRVAERAVAPPPPIDAFAKRTAAEAERSAAADSRAERARERRADERSDRPVQTVAHAPTRPAFVPPAAPMEMPLPSSASTPPSVESSGFATEEQHARARHVDPEEWLREIRELRAAGKTEDADREWKAFREAFPDYTVAEDDPAIGEGREE